MDTCQHEFYQHDAEWQCIVCGTKASKPIVVCDPVIAEFTQQLCRDLAAEIDRMFLDDNV